MTPDSPIGMSDEEFRLMRDLIYDYSGIYLPDSVKFIVERRLQTRLAVFHFDSYREYYRYLKYDDASASEFDEIVERITTNETYFFREAYQLKAFTDEILPEVLKDRDPQDRVRIWSAGCSSGEEPYTIAMLLDELGWTQKFRFDIFGNDISRKVLRMAREAFYRPSAFRQTEESYVKKYFDKQKDGYKLSDEIRNRVTFGHLNLMDAHDMALIANVDVIFCRNVMIYFAPESRAKLLGAFYKKLRKGGFLLLGHSESLINLSTQFELVPLKNDIVYRKPEIPVEGVDGLTALPRRF